MGSEHPLRLPHRLGRLLAWLGAILLTPIILAILFIAIFGWNWARGPIERMTLEKTGRALVIAGDLHVRLGWPAAHVRADAVTFANPPWAKEKQMVEVEKVNFTFDLLPLLHKQLVFPTVRLTHPIVALEMAPDGRRTWLLDTEQSDDSARIPIGRLTLDKGQLKYDEVAQKTSIRANLTSTTTLTDPLGTSDSPPPAATSTATLPAGTSSTSTAPAASSPAGTDTTGGVVFEAKGTYKGLSLNAKGSGGSVLALRDETAPYPLAVDGNIGNTFIKAKGSITSLLKFTAMDMQLALRGNSMAELFPVLGIALPETNPYVTNGHIVHTGKVWRYEKFTGRTGNSDIAGTLQVDLGRTRPFMQGELVSKVLDFADLAPLIGAKDTGPAKSGAKGAANAAGKSTGKVIGRPGTSVAATHAPVPPPAVPTVQDPAPSTAQTATTTVASTRVLPDIPFNTDKWDSLDADVTLRAHAILRAKELPLENLVTHLKLDNKQLTLDPMDFGIAGGHIKAVIALEGRQSPIQAKAKVAVRKLQLAKLFPTVELTKTSIGEVNGNVDLTGKGNSVGAMLGNADGRLTLIVGGGEISRLLMEEVGLHLFEILQLKLAGDRNIQLHCAVADFAVKGGVAQANTLVLDTQVTTVMGTGTVDLGRETLALTLLPKTRFTSPVALRSPIYVHGPFVKPAVEIDKASVAARGLGALALGLANPLLALIPLVDMGPGVQSQCAQLLNPAPR